MKKLSLRKRKKPTQIEHATTIDLYTQNIFYKKQYLTVTICVY